MSGAHQPEAIKQGQSIDRDLATLGARIAHARQARKLSQSALAETLGIPEASLIAWEANEAEPRISALSSIADQLDCALHWLLTGNQPLDAEPIANLPDNGAIVAFATNIGTDPIKLTQELIRCPSVTPEEGGALRLLDALLIEAGFETRRVDRNGVANLYARFGNAKPVFMFNGHTDVVPIGDEAAWNYPPFGATVADGRIYGRGACDMKSGVAAFVSAAIEFVKTPFEGSLMLLITGDEEGAGVDGTRALLDDLTARGERVDHAIVGEPTSPREMGEMIKIGRRGSLTAYIEAEGKQGHVAYPDRAQNPLPALITLLNDLQNWQLDDGYEDFQPSNLEVVSIDVGNTVTNVIPAHAKAVLNIRYNPNHSAESLMNEIDARIKRLSNQTKLSARYHASGDAFLTKQGAFTDLIVSEVARVTGCRAECSTSGGTSDARFIKDHCPVVECGLVGSSMHAVDEFVTIDEITQLKEIYLGILSKYFASEISE